MNEQKPQFDPSQPFEAVAEKPKFDPSKPFDVPAEKPRFDPTQPFQVAETEATAEADSREFAKSIANRDTSHHSVATPEELRKIAERNGVDYEWLRGVSAWYRQRPAADEEDAKSFFPGSVSDYVKEGAAGIDEMITGGAIRGAITKASDLSPEQQKALDDVRELADEKRPDWIDVAEFGGGLAAGIATGAPLARAGLTAAKAAGIGAGATRALGAATAVGTATAQGALSANYGEEVGGGLIGALAVTGLIGAGAAFRGVKKAASASLADDLTKLVDETGVIQRADEAFTAARPAEDLLAKVVTTADDRARNFSTFAKTTSVDEARAIASLADVGDAAKIAALEAKDPSTQAAKVLLGLDAPDAEVMWRAYAVARQTRSEMRKAAQVGNLRTREMKDYVAREGEEFTRAQFDRMRRAQYTTKEMAKVVTPAVDGEATDALGEIGALRRAWIVFADARYVYDAMDNRFGTALAPMLDRMSNRHNGYTVAIGAATKAQRPAIDAIRAAEKITKDGLDFRKAAWDALDSGDFSPERFTPKQVAALHSWRKTFADLADRADNLHRDFEPLGLTALKVERRLAGPAQSYVPHYIRELPEVVAEVEHRWARLSPEQRTSLVDTAKAWRAADEATRAGMKGGREADELLKAHEIFSNGPIETFAELTAVNRNLMKGLRAGEATSTFASSLAERRGEIPEWLLERDLAKLAQRWAHGTFRHAFLRDGLDEMRRASEVVSKVSPTLGKYIDNHVRDLAGVRRDGVAGQMQRGFLQYKLAAERRARAATTPTAQAAWKLVASVDDLLKTASGNMYSYFLGARVDNALRNYVQPFAMTAPQLGGGTYAYTRTAKAYGEVFRDTKAIEAAMRREGQLPSEQAFEAAQWIRRGIAETGPAGVAKDWLEGASRVSMLLYSAADRHNRVVTRRLASDVLDDARKGVAPALEAIRRLPSGYRTEVVGALRRGDASAAERAMQDYLLGSTQFNYNRVSMNEFGRYMGSLFSMFTKWPASFIGEVGGIVDARVIGKPIRGDLQRIGWKYLGPLIASSLAQTWWEDKREDVPGIVRKVVGEDLRKWAPSDTAIQLFREGPAQLPPAVQAIGAVGSSLAEGEFGKAAADLLDFGLSGTPGAIIPRFLMEELPEYLDAERRSPSIGKRIFGGRDED